MAAPLAGKVAIVTGGTSGLGAATAKRFVDDGAVVVLVGRNAAAATQVMADVTSRERIRFLRADVREIDQICGVVDAVVRELSGIDILVNSAGEGRLQPFLQTDAATLEAMLAVNLRGTFFFAQAVAQAMCERKRGGSIINISSISGQRGSALRAAYGMAKSAIIQLTRVVAVELAPYGIRVNAIAPGPIDTRAIAEAHLPTTRSAYHNAIPMGRFGTAHEVAAAAAFLASSEASYVTGHVLNVDGGFYAAGLMEQVPAAHPLADQHDGGAAAVGPDAARPVIMPMESQIASGIASEVTLDAV